MESQNINSISIIADALAPYFQQMKDYLGEKITQLIKDIDLFIFGDQKPPPLVSREVQDLTGTSVPAVNERTEWLNFSSGLEFLNDTKNSGADFLNNLDFLNHTQSIQETLAPILGKDASTITYSDAAELTRSTNVLPPQPGTTFTETVAIAKERIEAQKDFEANKEAIQAALAPFINKPSHEITLDDALRFIAVTDNHYSTETPIAKSQLSLQNKIQKAKEAMIEQQGEAFLMKLEFTTHSQEIKLVLGSFLNKGPEQITYQDVHNLLSYSSQNEPIKHDPETPLLNRVQGAINHVSSDMYRLDDYKKKY